MVVETAALKARTDILALVGTDTPLRKVASTRGGEFAGPCPFCGGRDRLRVQPDQGLWWCRGCSDSERWQDAIAYVMRRDGVPFAEACRILGGASDAAPAAGRSSGIAAVRRREMERRAAMRNPWSPPPVEDPEPSVDWRARGLQIVEACEAALWTDAGSTTREWLHARGLTDETLRRGRVGFNPSTRLLHGLTVERGITLPWLAAGELSHINIRRPAGDPKYKAVAGGHPHLYGADTLVGRPVAVLCEGEFDALLLAQEAGDLVGVASLGSASRQLGPRAIRLLLPIPSLLAAYDADPEGQRGAGRLAALSARLRRVSVPLGTDLTECHQQGGRLRDWIRLELARLQQGDVREADPDPETAYTAAGERVTAILADVTAAVERGDLVERARLLREVFTPAAEAYRLAGKCWAAGRENDGSVTF